MYIGTDDGEECVTIMPARTADTNVVRIAIRDKEKIHVIYYTQEQFSQRMRHLALQASHPVFFGVCKLLNWTLVIWAIWKLIHG